jgi:antitoxin ParD1/3/4
MSKNTSITLGEHFESFIGAQISEGRFGNVSEVVRAGLRLLEDEETKLQALRAALREGEESGPAVALDWDDFFTRKRVENTSR